MKTSAHLALAVKGISGLGSTGQRRRHATASQRKG